MSNEPHEDDDFDAPNQFEEFQRILREMLSADPGAQVSIDPSQLAGFAGLPADPKALEGMLNALRSAMESSGSADGGIDWSVARKTAIEVATKDAQPIDAAPAHQAFSTASLWLDEVTEMGGTADAPRTISRIEWTQQTIDTWVSLAEPVALSISDTLRKAMTEQLPEEMAAAMQGAEQMIQRVGGALFAMQLGSVVGNLSREVLSGGDIGIPLISGEDREGGALLPENVTQFLDGLDQEPHEVFLFLAVRELAHARLFRHSKWLRLHLLSAITEYAQGIEIDTARIEDLAHDIDPSNPEQLQELVRNGSLIPPRTPRQEAAHERLETMLALIEGWVDVVTEQATSRLPGAGALGEMMRRRRAAGGPSERAFATLVGLELRPRKLREAAAMWRLVGQTGDNAVRDSLWGHPDLLPTMEEIEHPARVLERLGLAGDAPDGYQDDFDRELAEFLRAEQAGGDSGEPEDS